MSTARRVGVRGAVLLWSSICAAACGASSGPTLWYAGTALCGLTSSQLNEGAKNNPAIIITSPSLHAFSDVALDAKGNLWAVGVGSSDVLRFAAGALQKSGAPTPELVLRSASLLSPGNLAFDSAGNLWVVDHQADSAGYLLRFQNPQALSGTQVVTPAARITTPVASDFSFLGAIAFDPSGSLWVTSFVGLLRFDQPQGRSGDASVAPDAVIEIAGYPDNVYFYSIAFDAGGSLWATAAEGPLENSIMKFARPGALPARSSPAPVLTIAGTAAGDILPAGGLAFDGDGSLWTANSEAILMYSRPGELSGSADPTPARSLPVYNQASPSLNAHLVFSPAPTPNR